MKITAVETQVWRSSHRDEVWPAWSPGASLVHLPDRPGLGVELGDTWERVV